MIRHDFLCVKCGVTTEVAFASFSEFVRQVECNCGGVATQTWRQAPGLAGVSEPGTRGITRTFHPGTYDVQAGRVFDSRSDRERYLKDRGLVALGPEEFKRTRDNTNEPSLKMDGLKDAMSEAWEEAKSSREKEPIPSVSPTNVNVVGEI